MLSLTCKVGIKAVIYLSAKSLEGKKVGFKEVADNIKASEHTIGKTLQLLVKQGIINSQKGPTGGFYLSNQQQEQAIYTIVETIDGNEIFNECGLGLHKCSAQHPCPIHDEYKIARELIEKIFKEKKIKDLRDPVAHGLAYLVD